MQDAEKARMASCHWVTCDWERVTDIPDSTHLGNT